MVPGHQKAVTKLDKMFYIFLAIKELQYTMQATASKRAEQISQNISSVNKKLIKIESLCIASVN